MVSILPSARTGMDVLGEHLGRGMTNAMPQMYENQKLQRGMSAIDRLQESIQAKPGEQVNQMEMLAKLARAITLNPGLERAGLVDYATKLAQAQASGNIPPPGGQGQSDQGFSEMQGQLMGERELPNFLNQPKQANQNYPNNIGPQGGPGNAPQESTDQQRVPIKNPTQLKTDAAKRYETARSSGIPMSMPEAYEAEKAENEYAKTYNESVENDRKARVASQKEYGARGQKALISHYKDAPTGLETIFQKKGEEASRKGKSEAEINRHLDEEAKRYANIIKNVSDKSAPRSHNTLWRAANGTYRNFNESAEDLRKVIQPLINDGEYDLARNLVANAGYYPEEREIILKPLSPSVQSAFNDLTKIGNTKPGSFSFRPSRDLEPLKGAIRKAQEMDSNFSQLLGRKMAEDKGYSWYDYKNALNELEGEAGFNLSHDQQTHRPELDTPPLSTLESVLHNLGLIGR